MTLFAIDGASNTIVHHYDEKPDNPVSSYQPVRIDYPTYSREFEYDQLGKVVKEIDILDEATQSTKSYVYDAAGNVILNSDAEGNTTRFEEKKSEVKA